MGLAAGTRMRPEVRAGRGDVVRQRERRGGMGDWSSGDPPLLYPGELLRQIWLPWGGGFLGQRSRGRVQEMAGHHGGAGLRSSLEARWSGFATMPVGQQCYGWGVGSGAVGGVCCGGG